jgi:hypothetical protein
MCNCKRNKTGSTAKWALVTSSGTQYFGSKLEADAARVQNGNQGTIRRV